MIIHGPTCAALIKNAISGERVLRGKVGRYTFTVPPLEITKQNRQIGIVSRGRRVVRMRTVMPFSRAIPFTVAIGIDGQLQELGAGEPVLDDFLAAQEPALAHLIATLEERNLEDTPDYLPNSETLPMLSVSWRSEAAFLITNIAIGLARKYVAVRQPHYSKSRTFDDIFEFDDVVYPMRRRRPSKPAA